MSLLAWLVLPVQATHCFERQGKRGSPEGNRHSPLVAAGQYRQKVIFLVNQRPLTKVVMVLRRSRVALRAPGTTTLSVFPAYRNLLNSPAALIRTLNNGSHVSKEVPDIASRF